MDSFFCHLYSDEEEDLRETGELQLPEEISKFASQITVVTWRLRKFLLEPGPMDFVGYLRRHPAYKDIWLEHLQLADGDLALGGVAIGVASLDEVQKYNAIAVERQIAAYWLQGDHAIYSKVDPATILMTC